MTPDEETDFAEKVVRLSYKCAEEMHISRENIVSNTFLKWLTEKAYKEMRIDPNEKQNIDTSV